MRRQWPCSKCGFACSSTWRSANPSKPVICNSCKGKGSSSNAAMDPTRQVMIDGPKTTNPFETIPSSLMHEAMPFNVGSNTFVFGANLPAPSTGVHDQQGSSKQKGKVVLGGNGSNSSTGCQETFTFGSGLKFPPFLMGDGALKINEGGTKKKIEEADPFVWNADAVKKKKRSKLPQYTPSPLERFIDQLHQISLDQQKENKISVYDEDEDDDEEEEEDGDALLIENPKYDDLFIYEKWNYIPENEIGLGCMLLTPPPSSTKEAVPEAAGSSSGKEVINPESASAKDNDPSCLIDVPIRSPSLSEEDERGEGSPLRHMNSTTVLFKPLKELYARGTPGEKTADNVKRPRGRPRKGRVPRNSEALRNSNENQRLDCSSSVDVPSSCSFNEDISMHDADDCEIEMLLTDVQKRMTLSMEEGGPLVIVVDSDNEAGNN